MKPLSPNMMGNFKPFILSLSGILADYITTKIGLRLSFYETHPQYHPIWALAIFWTNLILLTFLLPRKRLWKVSTLIISILPYLGAVNNLLVISGVFTGLKI